MCEMQNLKETKIRPLIEALNQQPIDVKRVLILLSNAYEEICLICKNGKHYTFQKKVLLLLLETKKLIDKI